MRVLYFTRDYTPHDYRFLSAMSASGLETFSLRLERRGRQLEDRPLPPQVTQIPWRGGQSPFRWRDVPGLVLELRRIIRSVEPDIVHAGPIQNAAFLAALAGAAPLVSMSWGSDLLVDAQSSRWMQRVTRYTLRASDLLVGDCQAVADKAADYGFPTDNTVLFPWGVDLNAFAPGSADDFRARQSWQDSFVLLSLRSWEPIYGVDVVVKAFAKAAQQAPELRLVLLGGGSLAANIQGLLHQNQLHDRVFLGGQVSQSDLTRFYHAADLYISASHSDGSSVSLLEALACAKPVLVSDIPGNREWITPTQEGWLFPDGNIDALAEAMLLAYRSREDLPRMGQNSRCLAEKRANWPENFNKLLQAYQKVTESGQERESRL